MRQQITVQAKLKCQQYLKTLFNDDNKEYLIDGISLNFMAYLVAGQKSKLTRIKMSAERHQEADIAAS